jgi:hypothetical protein
MKYVNSLLLLAAFSSFALLAKEVENVSKSISTFNKKSLTFSKDNYLGFSIWKSPAFPVKENLSYTGNVSFNCFALAFISPQAFKCHLAIFSSSCFNTTSLIGVKSLIRLSQAGINCASCSQAFILKFNIPTCFFTNSASCLLKYCSLSFFFPFLACGNSFQNVSKL